jgi:hypothetical protein
VKVVGYITAGNPHDCLVRRRRLGLMRCLGAPVAARGARRATSDEQPMGGGEAHAGHARDERTLDYARLSGHIEAFG